MFGLNNSQINRIEKEERRALLEEGFFIRSEVTLFTGTNYTRIERRLVQYQGRFFILNILHEPIMEKSGKWEIFLGDPNLGFLRIQDSPKVNDGESSTPHYEFKGKFLEPEVMWATESQAQMTKEERREIAVRKQRRR
jgi:hypothetical protein